MLARLIVVSVAAGTGSGISGCAPGYGVGVTGVAGRTGQRNAVIAGVVDRGVSEGNRRPGGRRMADHTFARSGHVAGVLACGGRAVMAARAATRNACVAEARGSPGERGVAAVALGRGGDVSGWLAG